MRKAGKAKLPHLQVRLPGNHLGIPLQSTITFTLHIQDRVAAEIWTIHGILNITALPLVPTGKTSYTLQPHYFSSSNLEQCFPNFCACRPLLVSENNHGSSHSCLHKYSVPRWYCHKWNGPTLISSSSLSPESGRLAFSFRGLFWDFLFCLDFQTPGL